MLRAISSFIRRRVQIDVGPTDIMLDVGSGDNPHWRADVLLEKHISANFAHHRLKGSEAMVDRRMVVGDKDMPYCVVASAVPKSSLLRMLAMRVVPAVN